MVAFASNLIIMELNKMKLRDICLTTLILVKMMHIITTGFYYVLTSVDIANAAAPGMYLAARASLFSR